MATFDFLKPLAAKAPILLKNASKFIDAHGDGDGIVEISDVIDTVKDGVSTVIDIVTDLF